MVMHRPGHSPSDTVFWDAERRILLAGDHLLPHISSNPLVSRPLPTLGETGQREIAANDRPHALIAYIDSMCATRELSAELVLPGHGDPITDHVSLIDARLRMHDRRARGMLKLLADGPLSAYEIALKMWGNVAVTQAFLTISEVLGHIDLLVRDGQARELETTGCVVRFEAAAA